MATNYNYDVTKLASLLSGKVVDETTGKERGFTDSEKVEIVERYCESVGISESEELKLLAKDIKTATKKVCGVIRTNDEGDYVCVSGKSIGKYLSSYKDNFLNDESVKEIDTALEGLEGADEVSNDEKSKYFNFLMGEKSTFLDEEKCNELLETNKNRVKNMKFSKVPDSLEIANAVMSLNEAASQRAYAEKVFKKCVENGSDIYNASKRVEEDYIATRDTRRIDAVENYFDRLGGIEAGEVNGLKSFTSFMDSQMTTGHKVTKTEVRALATRIATPEPTAGAGAGAGAGTGTPSTGTGSGSGSLTSSADTGMGTGAPTSGGTGAGAGATPTGTSYTFARRGFFSRLGRAIARHPFFTALITVGALTTLGAVLTLAGSPFILVNIGAILPTVFVGIPFVGGTTELVAKAVSPRYKNFRCDYDIEKNFKKIRKNSIAIENIINNAKSLAGAHVFDEITNVSDAGIPTATNRAKDTRIHELVTDGSINATTIEGIRALSQAKRREINKKAEANSRKVNKIIDIIGKKSVNSVDLGVPDASAFVRTDTDALDYERYRSSTDANEVETMRHISRFGSGSTGTPSTGTGSGSGSPTSGAGGTGAGVSTHTSGDTDRSL